MKNTKIQFCSLRFIKIVYIDLDHFTRIGPIKGHTFVYYDIWSINIVLFHIVHAYETLPIINEPRNQIELIWETN